VLLLAAVQMLVGAVYGSMCSIVTAYLLGSTLGAILVRRRSLRRGTGMLVAIGASSAIMIGATFTIILGLARLGASAAFCVVVLTTVAGVFGLLTGAAIPVAVDAIGPGDRTAFARAYSADVAGAALGAVVVGVFLLPRFGIGGTIVVTGVLCLMGTFTLMLTKRSAG